MSKTIKLTILLVVGLLFGSLIALNITSSRDKILEHRYDLLHENEAVSSKIAIDSILGTFEKLRFNQLDQNYLSWTKSNKGKYKKILRRSVFRVIKQDDFYKKIVGNFRIKDFVCKDSLYDKCLNDKEEKYYWLINEKLLYSVLELQNSLKKKGLNQEGFRINSGHRHPKKIPKNTIQAIKST